MSELPNDEIDLVELFQVIWDGKWLIAGLSALIILPTLVFLALIHEPEKRASINILPLSSSQMNFYGGINLALDSPVTAEGFQDTFLRELYKGKIAQDIIAASDSRIAKFDGTETEKITEIANVASESLTVEIPDEETLTPSIISFVGKNEVEARNILRTIVHRLDKQTARLEKEEIDNARATKQRSLNFEIIKTEIEIENTLDDYQTRTKARKVYLAEQLAIARTIGIEENGFSNLLSKGSITGISGQNSLPFYMRGSRAIAKELSLLEARSTSREASLNYIGTYPELRAKLLAHQTDPSIAHLDKELANSPFANNNQKTMNYDLNSITIASTQSKFLILILVSILTGILATFFVIIRHYFILNRSTQTAE